MRDLLTSRLPKSSDPKCVTMVCCNINGLGIDYGKIKLLVDASRVTTGDHADIICLQETTRPVMQSKIEPRYNIFEVFSNKIFKPTKKGSGLATLVKATLRTAMLPKYTYEDQILTNIVYKEKQNDVLDFHRK
jgi:exonuclease III